jgi:hypothetical protein
VDPLLEGLLTLPRTTYLCDELWNVLLVLNHTLNGECEIVIDMVTTTILMCRASMDLASRRNGLSARQGCSAG